MLDLTLEDIREYTGQQGRKIGQEYVFMCPACFDEKGKDNLHFNEKKGILWCFANEQHNKDILSEIMKKKNESKKMEKTNEIPSYIINREKYLFYQILCNDALLGKLDKDWIEELKNQDMFEKGEYEFYLDLIETDKPRLAREYLETQTGINKDTIEMSGLGLDFFKNKWVFPIYDMSANLVGFEYRYKDLKQKKIWRQQGTPKCMALVYGNGKNLYVQEGYKDSYLMIQILKHHNMLDDATIVTSSNGVAGTLDVMSNIQFSKYDNIYLCLDNDKIKEKVVKNGKPQDVSRQMTKAIIEKYPFIKDRTPKFTDEELKQGYKDIADIWKLKYSKVR